MVGTCPVILYRRFLRPHGERKSLNLKMLNERLTSAIGSFAGAAMETRQIAKRLRELLPARLRDIKRDHIRRGDAMGSKAERLALTDPRYLQTIEELAEINFRARMARVQWETHSMLFKARQSIRAFNRR